MSAQLTMETIGVIHTPFRDAAGTPIQPSRAQGARGTVHVDARFQEGLKDLEGVERIWRVYWFHRAPSARLVVKPFLDVREHGVFATRAPARPSPIGISVVRLVGIRDGILEVEGVDMINGTPLLDIKPYVPEFDSYPNSKAGWFDQTDSDQRLADDRFQPAGTARRGNRQE